MNDIQKITSSHLTRVAVVYLRQSSSAQVEHNRESTDRQYALAHSFSVRIKVREGRARFRAKLRQEPKMGQIAHKEAREQRKSSAPGEALRTRRPSQPFRHWSTPTAICRLELHGSRDTSRLRAYTAGGTANSGCSNDRRCSRGDLVDRVVHRRLWNGHRRPLFVETR